MFERRVCRGQGKWEMARAVRHLALAVGIVALAAIGVLTIAKGDLRARVSLSSAYLALALFAVTLVLGPLNRLRRRPNPVNTTLRRDIGIWTGLTGLVHLLVGLTVHLRGRPWEYLVDRDGVPRFDLFGVANYTGLGAGLLLLLLLTLSNDRALRALGTCRWKALQRLAYVAFGLTMLHGALYQVVEKRTLGFVLSFWAVGLGTLVVQVIGVWRCRLAQRASLAPQLSGESWSTSSIANTEQSSIEGA
jgi:sulfoxide reductase heme-binding subunit YedZ